MRALQFTPVIRACGARDARRPATLTISETESEDTTWQLACDDNGSLKATKPDNSIGRAVGWLRLRHVSGKSSWFFVPATTECGVNGTTPPFPVVLLRPGMLMSLGDEFWVVSSLWSPEPIDAPPELADKNCSVCGLELGCAPVVPCLCGNYMHLENPEAPDDPDALNCYLTKAKCGACQRPTSLDPQVVPEIPEALLDAEPDLDLFGDDVHRIDVDENVTELSGKLQGMQ